MELRTCPERFVCDSIVLRQFCRLYLESAPDDTTLIRWANQIGPQTVASLNDRVVELGIDQAVRRVLREEQVPASEKVLSLFEEHTMITTRRKVGKPREYGRKVLLDEVDGGIISR
jgi:hypothetical protein